MVLTDAGATTYVENALVSHGGQAGTRAQTTTITTRLV